MAKKTMGFIIVSVGVIALGYGIWKTTFRNAYESAEYSVVAKYDDIEIRNYPDLKVVSTHSSDDGGFGRLFRYISGSNEGNQTIAMTTPVFMLKTPVDPQGSMSFVIPTEASNQAVPQPLNSQVEIGNRPGGLYAVIRYSGRDSEKARFNKAAVLKSWIENNDFSETGVTEFAGYDPPWTPAFFRRNEILIRIEHEQ